MRSRLVTAVVAAALILTACSGPARVATVAVPAGQLSGICPATVVVQTAWWPESTQGGLYQALIGGTAPQVDTDRNRVSGVLYDGGRSTGVRLELRPGVIATNYRQASELMAFDRSITLGQEATEDQILGWAKGQPTVMVFAPFTLDPEVLIWDAERHPTWNTIQDVGLTNNTVFTFQSAALDYLLHAGILRSGQVNRSYDGSPSFFMSQRDAAVGGFATNELYTYNKLGVKTGYAYVADTGYPNYRDGLIIRAGDETALAPCLKRLIPVFQRAYATFTANPDTALKLIVDLVRQYHASYSYTLEQGRYGVEKAKTEPLMSAGPAFGSLDAAKLGSMIEIMRSIYDQREQKLPASLTRDSLGNNAYIDPSIQLNLK